MLALEDTRFQLLQSEALSPCRRPLAIATLSIPWSYFWVPPNQDAHPTSRFVKTFDQNPIAPTADHKINRKLPNLWHETTLLESPRFPYSRFGVIINMVLERKQFLLWYDWRHPIMHMPELHQNILHGFRKRKGNEHTTNTCYVCLDVYARQITTMTSTSMLQRLPTTRLCDYFNLQMLLNVSGNAHIVFTLMFQYVST